MKLQNLRYYRGHRVRKALKKAELLGIKNCIFEIRQMRNDCLRELSIFKTELGKNDTVVLRAKVKAFNSILEKFGRHGEFVSTTHWWENLISI